MTLEEMRTAVREAVNDCSPLARISYKLREAAEVTGLSESFLRSEIRRKHLTAVKVSHTAVLIEADAIRRYLAERRMKQEAA